MSPLIIIILSDIIIISISICVFPNQNPSFNADIQTKIMKMGPTFKCGDILKYNVPAGSGEWQTNQRGSTIYETAQYNLAARHFTCNIYLVFSLLSRNGMVTQWLALRPHSKKFLGLIPGPAALLCLFSPERTMARRWTGHSSKPSPAFAQWPLWPWVQD